MWGTQPVDRQPFSALLSTVSSTKPPHKAAADAGFGAVGSMAAIVTATLNLIGWPGSTLLLSRILRYPDCSFSKAAMPGGGVVSVTNGSAVFYIDESPTNLHPSVVAAEQ
jgi:hypothetical protein